MAPITRTTPRSACARYAAHSLDEVTGYVAIRTIAADGTILVADGRGDVLAVVDGAGRYLEAREVARAHRAGREYAIVGYLHGCPVCDPIVLAGGEPHYELT